MTTDKILRISNVFVQFPVATNIFGVVTKTLNAVNGISFDVTYGETVGIIGESGCGKSTLAKALVGLNKITSGSVILDNQHKLHTYKRQRDWWNAYEDIQMIFQDPIASLDPCMTVGDIISEPLTQLYDDLNGKEIKDEVMAMLKKVNLNEFYYDRYVHELSGGQCQRVGIARALICKPKLLVCDEPISALDVSVQAQIINLLKDLKAESGLTVLFITHNLSVLKHISDRILVFYLGNIVEVAETKNIYTSPHHPYTLSLLNAIPTPIPDENFFNRNFIEGELPSPLNPPCGCLFRLRCKRATVKCIEDKPVLKPINNDESSYVACHYPINMS